MADLPALSARVALVTGAASGIGAATASRLVADGFVVIATDIDEHALEMTASAIGCEYVVHDVTDENRWAAVVDEIVRRHGGLHILVNNAGTLGPAVRRDVLTTSLDDWRGVMRTNVESVFLGCRTAVPAIHLAGGGSIVNMSSASALKAGIAVAYGASKSAVLHLTKDVARFCAEQGMAIRCNSIHPGWVSTRLNERRADEVAAERGISAQKYYDSLPDAPLGGWIEPEEVAAMVSYLVSEQARNVTGAEFVIDGGAVGCR